MEDENSLVFLQKQLISLHRVDAKKTLFMTLVGLMVLSLVLLTNDFKEKKTDHAGLYTRRSSTGSQGNGSLSMGLSCRRDILKLLEQEFIAWTKTESSNAKISNLKGWEDYGGECINFVRQGQLNHGLTTNIFNHTRPKKYKMGDVMIAVQLSSDRIDRLIRMTTHWSGPISAAVYVYNHRDPLLLDALCRLKSHVNVFVHLVHAVGDIFPTNYLRNVAMKEVFTEFTFISDVDFMSHLKLYKYLVDFIKKDTTPLLHNSTAFVVPAFEMKLKKTVFPFNKGKLIKLWDKRRLVPFHELMSSKGHKSTDFEHWKIATKLYKVTKYITQFEPYIMVRTCSVPRYEKAFVGRRKNKISHTFELHTAGYEFWVFPDVFIVHMPHKQQITGTGTIRCANAYFKRWAAEIIMRYNGRQKIDHTCDRRISLKETRLRGR